MNRASQIRKGFADYHRANPEVYARFCYHAQSIIQRGGTRYATNTLIHVIRFERHTVAKDVLTGFKINNNYCPYYARLWELDHPEHPNFFAKRELISRRTPAVMHEPTVGDYPAQLEIEPDLEAFLKALLEETKLTPESP